MDLGWAWWTNSLLRLRRSDSTRRDWPRFLLYKFANRRYTPPRPTTRDAKFAAREDAPRAKHLGLAALDLQLPDPTEHQGSGLAEGGLTRLTGSQAAL